MLLPIKRHWKVNKTSWSLYRAIGLVLDFIHRLVCGSSVQHKPSSESFQVCLDHCLGNSSPTELSENNQNKDGQSYVCRLPWEITSFYCLYSQFYF
jgi:hypothetical protein